MNTKRSLTPRQSDILEFLKDYTSRHGYPPTISDISQHFGFYQGAAKGHLLSLQKKGYIRINPNKSRGIEILGLGIKEALAVPVLGKIRAGEPIYTVEEIDSHIYVDKSLFPCQNPFSLRVTGDSMRDVGILEGDFVIVNPQKVVQNGDIAVVLIGEEATIKRVFLQAEDIILKPENKDMQPKRYKTQDITLLGKVVGVIRKI
ncbi:MAG: transcriptional repressor LexA [Thermodesulfovibrionales bacterium]|nr:transcriptional repressor LexA [Thermodesulfovibrionales bacterium]